MEKPQFPEDRVGKESQIPRPASKQKFYSEELSIWQRVQVDFGFNKIEDFGYDDEYKQEHYNEH